MTYAIISSNNEFVQEPVEKVVKKLYKQSLNLQFKKFNLPNREIHNQKGKMDKNNY